MTDNDNLELKKRSRRRLVGAAALALLAAIVLPMVMDQEPDSPAQDIQITIPDREADTALARPIAGRPDTPADVPQVAPPPQEQPPGPQPESAATPSAPAEPPPASAATAPGSAGSPKPVEPSKSTAAQKPSGDKPAAPPADEAARVRALLEGRPGVASAPSEAFVVQVGAFGDVAKAASISTELKGKGFAAYTEKTGTVTRVRIGPFPSREEAAKVAERLRADGMQGVVTVR